MHHGHHWGSRLWPAIESRFELVAASLGCEMPTAASNYGGMVDSNSIAASADLTRRWQDQLTLLQAQLSSAPTITVASTRGRLRKLYEQAELAGMALPQPTFADEVFTGMVFGSDTAQAIAKFATEEVERERKREMMRLRQAAYFDKLAEKAGIKRRKRHALPPGSNDCLCGCGGKANGYHHFIAGHSALWYNWMKRIERGEMPRECLNPTMQEKLRWGRCMMCGGFIPTTDPFGHPLPKRLGYDCQRRARRLKKAEGVDPRLKAVLEGDEKEAARWDVCARHSAYEGRKAKSYVGPRRIREKK